MPHTVELPKQADVTRSRLPSLTGMRFIAAVGVFLFHGILYGGFFSSTHAVGVLGSVVNVAGWAGVVFFFILSGFVLTWSLRPKDTVPSFWRRRLLKVFPNHLVTSIPGQEPAQHLPVAGVGAEPGDRVLRQRGVLVAVL
jgi:peptidoglycan/LPS O-acetylase OafA/YrhL